MNVRHGESSIFHRYFSYPVWNSINLCCGCKKQELAKLTITIEGKELSDAQIYADEKYVGSLTQTIIAADGGIYRW